MLNFGSQDRVRGDLPSSLLVDRVVSICDQNLAGVPPRELSLKQIFDLEPLAQVSIQSWQKNILVFSVQLVQQGFEVRVALF